MSGLCTKEKKAIIEYGFGKEKSKIYLARKTPVEVRTGVGMPPSYYPPKSNMVNKGVLRMGTEIGVPYNESTPFFFSFTTPYASPGGDIGLQCWVVIPGAGNNPPYVSQGDRVIFETANVPYFGNRSPIVIGSVPVYGGDAWEDGVYWIEVWLKGVATYKDFGRGKPWYTVKCGNGCVEDEEITITEVSSYPGHWCLTEEEMSKLRRADRVLKRTGENLDSYLKELNAENDRLRRELSKPLPPIRPDPPT